MRAATDVEGAINRVRPTAQLHQLGQSLWLDNITRGLLTSGTLKRYIDELSITGLTSNPTIFDHAISHGTDYDIAIRDKRRGRSRPTRSCSSTLLWKTSRRRPICSCRFT